MKKVFLISYCLLLSSYIFGQSVNQKVFATSGQSVGQFAYTIGEPLVNTLVSNRTITQGFHQTRLTVVSTENTLDLVSVKLLPNPTSDFIALTVEGYDKSLHLQILDMQGHIISEEVFIYTENCNVTNLPQGTYIVIVTTSDNKIVNRSKFIKL